MLGTLIVKVSFRIALLMVFLDIISDFEIMTTTNRVHTILAFVRHFSNYWLIQYQCRLKARLVWTLVTVVPILNLIQRMRISPSRPIQRIYGHGSKVIGYLKFTNIVALPELHLMSILC